jgi:NAD(P)-dependent dehydrogenase (short-subunit alcohol dehydrogenase family)
VIVVVGDPVLRPADGGLPSLASGRAAAIARACVRAGATVQLVGKVGDDAAGDQVLLSLTRDGVGHVALLRDAGRSTGIAVVPPAAVEADPSDADPDWATSLVDDSAEAAQGGGAIPDEPDPPGATAPSSLAPEDLDLALRYLTSFGVLVIAAPLTPATLAVAVESAAYAGAHLIHLGPADGMPPVPVDDVTMLEPPPADPEDGFAALVGRYAAELDGGTRPAAAFRTALRASGWESTAP